MVKFIENPQDRQEICFTVLNSLPDWFGVPESVRQYAQGSRNMPCWASFEGDEPTGFVAMKATSRYCAEIYVMGVLPSCHRKGSGTELFCALRDYARSEGFEYLQVKTVREGMYDDYDLTNAFYKKMGFRELECFDTLWDETNPCQIYIMYIG